SALTFGDAALVVAVWDRRLHAGAVASHLRVAPRHLDD
ncbi:MAG: type II toxin-antitoxin system VapC family toxin, partial [Acidimicrobiales bacterium]